MDNVQPPPSGYICHQCGQHHDELPMCFGSAAPWADLGIREDELADRVDQTDDVCVVDQKYFFVRGHIEIPVHDLLDSFCWSVWCSLSKQSFSHMMERWDVPDRVNDPPYFGWLMTPISGYPSTLHLKTSVQSRAVGCVPHFTLEPTDHPLAIEQHQGITVPRVHEIVHQLLYADQ